MEHNRKVILFSAMSLGCMKSLVTIKFLIFLAFASGVLIGCVNTEGTLEIKGKVIDEGTKVRIPGRDIIVQGLLKSNDKLVPIEAGQFSTDSSGYFSYSLKKVKDVRYYSFSLVGDSDYAFITRILGLMELEQNAKYLSFSLTKLVDLTIKMNRKSKSPVCDTLFLSWQSNQMDGRFLYPYKIINFEPMSGFESGWVGGKVKSTIKTRAAADKRTTVRWVLFRNGQIMEFIDTITCKRDFANIVYFTY